MNYAINNILITCPICQNDSFHKDYRQLNSRGATFLGFDWANKNAGILICQQCTHISWFYEDPMSVKK